MRVGQFFRRHVFTFKRKGCRRDYFMVTSWLSTNRFSIRSVLVTLCQPCMAHVRPCCQEHLPLFLARRASSSTTASQSSSSLNFRITISAPDQSSSVLILGLGLIIYVRANAVVNRAATTLFWTILPLAATLCHNSSISLRRKQDCRVGSSLTTRLKYTQQANHNSDWIIPHLHPP